MTSLRAGIARVRTIVSAAKQAIGKAPREGAVLSEEPGEPAAPAPEPPAPAPEQ